MRKSCYAALHFYRRSTATVINLLYKKIDSFTRLALGLERRQRKNVFFQIGKMRAIEASPKARNMWK